MSNFDNFIIQFWSNILATVIGGIFLFYFLENKVRRYLDIEEKKRLLKNLYTDTVKNYIIVERIIDSSDQTSNTQFPIARLKVDSADKFLYQRGIPAPIDFYNKLSGTIANMESINNLISLIFVVQTAQAILENKKNTIEAAKNIQPAINELLRDLDSFNNTYNFYDRN